MIAFIRFVSSPLDPQSERESTVWLHWSNHFVGTHKHDKRIWIHLQMYSSVYLLLTDNTWCDRGEQNDDETQWWHSENKGPCWWCPTGLGVLCEVGESFVCSHAVCCGIKWANRWHRLLTYSKKVIVVTLQYVQNVYCIIEQATGISRLNCGLSFVAVRHVRQEVIVGHCVHQEGMKKSCPEDLSVMQDLQPTDVTETIKLWSYLAVKGLSPQDWFVLIVKYDLDFTGWGQNQCG